LKKILVLVPNKNARGGITNYYDSLKNYFGKDIIYLTRGARNWPKKQFFLFEVFRLFKDFFKFILIISKRDIKLIQTTTSFSTNALFRDSIYILLSKIFNKKVIVFYRGWDELLVKKIEKHGLFLFKWVYFKADAFIDLASTNIETLRKWGYKKSIFLETTVVDNKLIEGINYENIKMKYGKNQEFKILFLARVEKTKGVYELISTYNLLKVEFPNISLIIAGDGNELVKVKEFAKNSKDIIFRGFVSGQEKADLFKECQLFFFPSYFEGMPNSVLEAITCGMPVVTRRVGGLIDFFKDNVHGYITDSKDPEIYKNLISSLIKDPEICKKIAIDNFDYGGTRFLANKVVERVEQIYKQILN
jgi:glycosyltransferase involved in cell wall biosynthesis